LKNALAHRAAHGEIGLNVVYGNAIRRRFSDDPFFCASTRIGFKMFIIDPFGVDLA
jgi:hypothetical protein